MRGAAIELIYMVESTQHFFTIKCGTYYFYFEILHSKPVMLLGLCLVLANNLFSSIFTRRFKCELSS